MKNFFLIVSEFLMTRNTSVRWIADEMTERIRRITMTVVMSLAALIFLNAAVQLIMTDIQRSSERQQALTFTSISLIGLFFVVLSLSAIYLFLRKSMWWATAKTTAEVPELPLSSKMTSSSQSIEPSPLLHAISALVMDFIEERREERIRKTASTSQIQNL